MPPNQHHIATLSECLRDLDITSSTIFTECDSIDAEFAAVKKYYFRKVLKDHPDKGGDVDRFRKTQAAFEVVREMYQNGGIRVSLAVHHHHHFWCLVGQALARATSCAGSKPHSALCWAKRQ